MVTADQILAHLVGDYLLQSDWMAQRKRASAWVAIVHALAYTVAFLPLTTSPTALLVIAGTHALIDHFALARYVVFAKNYLAPPSRWPTWARCSKTGYDESAPPWLATWLLIIADNVMHIAINAGAIWWAG